MGTTLKIGDIYIKSDGSTIQKVGNTFFDSKNGITTKDNGLYFKSDGSIIYDAGCDSFDKHSDDYENAFMFEDKD